jgi:hypothetical protein
VLAAVGVFAASDKIGRAASLKSDQVSEPPTCKPATVLGHFLGHPLVSAVYGLCLLTAPMMEVRPQMAERRARILRWVSFAPTATVATGSSKTDEKCAVCWGVITSGQPHFILTFKNAFSVRLDEDCLRLWREIAE